MRSSKEGIAQMLQTEGGALQRERVEMRAPSSFPLSPSLSGERGAMQTKAPWCFINVPSITQEIPQLPACLSCFYITTAVGQDRKEEEEGEGEASISSPIGAKERERERGRETAH